MKRKMIILILMIMILPTIAKARTYEEALDIASELGFANNSDGTCSYYSPSIPFETIIANDCALTFEEYVAQNSWLEGKSTSEKQSYYNQNQNECKTGIIFDVITLDYQEEEWANQHDLSFNYDSTDRTLDIAVKYNNRQETFSRTCEITFDDIDTSIVNTGKNIANNIPKINRLYGLDSLVYERAVPHNPLTEASMFMFKNFRNYLLNSTESIDESIKENFAFEIHIEPYTYSQVTGNAMYATPVVYYQGTIIATRRNTIFDFTHVIPVDKSLSGTTLQKAQKELELLFGKDVQFEIVPDEMDWGDILSNEMNDRLGTTNVEYTGTVANIKLGDQTIYSVFFVELEKDKVERYEATALDKTTGIRVKTNSYDITSDIALHIKEVKNKDYVKKAVKDKYTMLSAYDINLFNYITSPDRITEIKNGLQIYIPIKDKKLGEKLLVQHIKVDGTKYVKFTTTHLSTFAVYEQIKEGEKNPETADYITMIVIGIPIICLAMLNILPKLKKNRYE